MKVRFQVGASAATLLTALAACGGSDDPAPTPIPQLSAATPASLAYCSELTTRAAFANTNIAAASAVAAGTLTVAGTPVGPSTDQFDMLTPLVAWVEQGTAPDSVVATARGVGNAAGANAAVPTACSPTRTRPLCPSPKVAKYKGSGDIELADSFSCQ